eukprot:GHVU01195842.1.p1 GENE.GHVU01195842.1~~GHVU01195842.1.p1  ORF type:complete len:118 (-),score=8.15 GHVU01195842.1:232-585(-)
MYLWMHACMRAHTRQEVGLNVYSVDGRGERYCAARLVLPRGRMASKSVRQAVRRSVVDNPASNHTTVMTVNRKGVIGGAIDVSPKTDIPQEHIFVFKRRTCVSAPLLADWGWIGNDC